MSGVSASTVGLPRFCPYVSCSDIWSKHHRRSTIRDPALTRTCVEGLTVKTLCVGRGNNNIASFYSYRVSPIEFQKGG